MRSKILTSSACILAFLLLFAFYFCLRPPASYTKTEFAMDTVMRITAYGKGAKKATEQAFNRIYELDARLNANNKDSDIAAINNAPLNEPVTVHEDVIKLLTTAVDFNQKTKGAFDTSLFAVTKLWAFGTKDAAVPDEAALQNTLEETGLTKLMIHTDKNTVTKTAENPQLDLGAIAKGYAANEAVRILKQAGIHHAYLDLGGNVAVFGGMPLSVFDSIFKGASARPFAIGIQDPNGARGNALEILHLTDGFVVTSGDYERFFEQDGKKYHHILNPQTGHPADSGYKSVTIVCDNGTVADILSTAVFVAGKDLLNDLSGHYQKAILIDHNGAITTVMPD